MAKSLAEIEEEHGFVFGVPDDDPSHGQKRARVMKHLKCSTPGCARADERVDATPIHHDTALPVICGECGAVLLCNHEPDEEMISIEGTMVEPVRRIKTPCRICGSIIEDHTESLRPVALEDLPAAALQALGVAFHKADD